MDWIVARRALEGMALELAAGAVASAGILGQVESAFAYPTVRGMAPRAEGRAVEIIRDHSPPTLDELRDLMTVVFNTLVKDETAGPFSGIFAALGTIASDFSKNVGVSADRVRELVNEGTNYLYMMRRAADHFISNESSRALGSAFGSEIMRSWIGLASPHWDRLNEVIKAGQSLESIEARLGFPSGLLQFHVDARQPLSAAELAMARDVEPHPVVGMQVSRAGRDLPLARLPALLGYPPLNRIWESGIGPGYRAGDDITPDLFHRYASQVIVLAQGSGERLVEACWLLGRSLVETRPPEVTTDFVEGDGLWAMTRELPTHPADYAATWAVLDSAAASSIAGLRETVSGTPRAVRKELSPGLEKWRKTASTTPSTARGAAALAAGLLGLMLETMDELDPPDPRGVARPTVIEYPVLSPDEIGAVAQVRRWHAAAELNHELHPRLPTASASERSPLAATIASLSTRPPRAGDRMVFAPELITLCLTVISGLVGLQHKALPGAPPKLPQDRQVD